MNEEVLPAAAAALQRGEPAALVTIVRSTGSTPQRTGAKMLVFADGRTVGTIGGGCYENESVLKAREAIASGTPALVKYDLNDDFVQESGLICGGQMEVYIDPIAPAPALYIIGAGHVGWHLSRFAAEAGFRIHVVDDREKFANQERFPRADSIVVDPHKHGLQPYGCGCVLFRDPEVGRLYRHDSPYTYFTSGELHLGEISLECSRAGASAVALWATQRLLPLTPGGELARGLSDGREAALALHDRIAADRRFVGAFRPELDIVVWLPRAKSARAASELSRRVFEESARRGLHLAVAQLPVEFFELEAAGVARDADTVSCLRSVLMKPEHRAWIDEIWKRLGEATDAVGGASP